MIKSTMPPDVYATATKQQFIDHLKHVPYKNILSIFTSNDPILVKVYSKVFSRIIRLGDGQMVYTIDVLPNLNPAVHNYEFSVLDSSFMYATIVELDLGFLTSNSIENTLALYHLMQL